MTLSNVLTEELQKHGSDLQLSPGEFPFNQNMAFGEKSTRSIDVNQLMEDDMFLISVLEKGYTAATIETKGLEETAILIDYWLSKDATLEGLQETFPQTYIEPSFIMYRTLPDDQILELQWQHHLERIEKGEIRLRIDLFQAIRKHFGWLYPCFSHERLFFSYLIGEPSVPSPAIYSLGMSIFVIKELYVTDNTPVSVANIDEAINLLSSLIQWKKADVVNPLKQAFQ